MVGGTASMRARARSILTGMGPTAIAQVRIGPPPARFGLNAATNSMWLTVTLHRPPALARAQWTQLAGGSTLWQASVFENAFTRSAPRGEPRVRGSTEAVQGPPMTGTGSGTFDRPRFTGPSPTDAEVRAAIGDGARRAGFDVVSLRVMHPGRPAASVVVRANQPEGFDRRYAAFDDAVSRIERRMDGFQWEVVDPCGRPVVMRSAVSWADPRWLCPDPTVLGFGESAADCRKQPKPDLSC